MQHVKSFLSLLSLTAMVATAAAEATPEAAARQLGDALARELSALASVQDAASAAAAVPQLQAVLAELASMERSYEAEKKLWIYIDNTEGVKTPLIELLQRLAVEFARLDKASFYGNAELGELLAPQLKSPETEAKQDAAE